MNRNIIKRFTALVSGLVAFATVNAETFTTNAGVSHDGEIYKVIEETVTLQVGDEKIEIALADFDGATKAAIESWESAHPEKVDVYTKWDEQPKIKSSAMPSLPEQFHNPDFKGMVSVDLVLSDSGHVIYAAVKKSTHSELEEPSLEAAKSWIFEPAKVGGKSVKSKLRVPFKFVYSPSEDGKPTS